MADTPLLAERIRDALRAEEGRMPDFEAVSRGFAMHPRTLRRRLRDEGTSYLQLRNEARREFALRLLVEDQLSHEQVAFRLGMSDASSFRRALLRWNHGTSAP